MAPLFAIILVCAALIWGDWRNFRKYYPTMLFIYTVNLLELVFSYKYTLWRFHNAIPGVPNHVPAVLLILFVNFTALILVFLSRFPKKLWKQVLWTLLFIAINSTFEWIGLHKHNIAYDHGWSYGWSVVINVLTYTTIRLHHSRPLLAWVFTILIFAFFLWYFKFPLHEMK